MNADRADSAQAGNKSTRGSKRAQELAGKRPFSDNLSIQLRLAISDGNLGKVKSVEWSLANLYERLSQPAVDDITHHEYLGLSKDEQTKRKNKAGYFIGGPSLDGRRRAASIGERQVLTLDLDEGVNGSLPIFLELGLTAGSDFEFGVHSTRKSTELKPRLRFAFPLERAVTREEYQALARIIAHRIDPSMDFVDPASFRPEQAMFFPTVSSDSIFFWFRNSGPLLDPDAILDEFGNWRDHSKLPRSEKRAASRRSEPGKSAAADPRTYAGLRGAFCRAFPDIRDVISRFLSDIYVTGENGRYSYVRASTENGVEFYDGGRLLYSFHSSDPHGGKRLCGFDAVRLHLFGELDCDASEPASEMELPSFVRMVEFASGLDEVRREDNKLSRCLAMLEGARNYNEGIEVASRLDLMPSELEAIIPRLIELAKAEGRAVTAGAVKRDYNKARSEAKRAAAAERDKELEDRIADAVLREHYDNGKQLLRYAKSFWWYLDGVWEPHETEIVKSRAYDVIVRATESEDGDLAEALSRSSRVNNTNALSEAVTGAIEKKSVTTESDPFGFGRMNVPSVINCHNGELWFDEGKVDFRQHDPANRLTYQLATAYEPTATCEAMDAAMERYFHGSSDKDDVIRHLWEVLGYAIQPVRIHKCFAMLHGTGDNGKTLIFSVMQILMGVRAILARPLHSFGQNAHDEATLVGRLLLADDDYRAGELLPDDMLKKLSEAKLLSANPKFASTFNFVARCFVMILTNPWPATRDNSKGMATRPLVFDFKHEIPAAERDTRLLQRIVENELPGVLNRCIEGWCRLQKRRRFEAPPSCIEAFETWRSRSNAISSFLHECTTTTKQPEDIIKGTVLWELFDDWQRDSKVGHGIGRNSFYDAVADRSGVVRGKTGNATFFGGLQLKPAGQNDDVGKETCSTRT